VQVIGFSEHADSEMNSLHNNGSRCLVMGAEDVGLSNAVSRCVTNTVAFKSQGEIESLNVSVASALAMQAGFTQS